MRPTLRTSRTVAGRGHVLNYRKITDARTHLLDVYDAASANLPVVIRREDDAPVAVVPQASLIQALRALVPLDAQVQFDDDGHVFAWLPGLPISADGDDFDAAIGGLVDALRDYAQVWVDDLRHYPNHEENWGLVQLVLLSDDQQLAAHIAG